MDFSDILYEDPYTYVRFARTGSEPTRVVSIVLEHGIGKSCVLGGIDCQDAGAAVEDERAQLAQQNLWSRSELCGA
ncbi:hypothetical protein LTR16_009350, partial [Cryomyces antarcticus]